MFIENEVRCCGSHLDYPTPVISTFKWLGREFWCPHCGRKYQFFDGFKYFESSEVLENRGKEFLELATPYLSDKVEDFELNQKPDIQ